MLDPRAFIEHTSSSSTGPPPPQAPRLSSTALSIKSTKLELRASSVGWGVKLSSTATLSAPPKLAPLPDALRRDIAAMVRALPDEELLALVGDRLAGLVARHATLALPVPQSAPSSPAKPRPRRARPEPEPTPLDAAEAAPERGRKAPVLPWPRTAPDGTPLGIDLAGPGLTPRTKTIADDVRRLVLARWKGNVAALLDAQKRYGEGQVVCYLWSETVFEALQRHFERASVTA
jgi:hypothetical protein